MTIISMHCRIHADFSLLCVPTHCACLPVRIPRKSACTRSVLLKCSFVSIYVLEAELLVRGSRLSHSYCASVTSVVSRVSECC